MNWYPLEIRHESTEAAERGSYDTIYTTRGIRQRDSFYLWFLEQVHACAPGKRLLDVSCGEGTFLHMARRAGFAAVGMDFSRSALDVAQQAAPTAATALANAQALPFATASFDVLTNIGSLEHYFDPAAGVCEMARVLRPGGVAVVLLPNAFGLLGNLVHVWQHGEIYDDGQPLQRYASRRSWEHVLADNGLPVWRTIGYERERPRTLTDLAWTARNPSKALRWMIGPLVPLNLGNMLVFFCRRAAAPAASLTGLA